MSCFSPCDSTVNVILLNGKYFVDIYCKYNCFFQVAPYADFNSFQIRINKKLEVERKSAEAALKLFHSSYKNDSIF